MRPLALLLLLSLLSLSHGWITYNPSDYPSVTVTTSRGAVKGFRWNGGNDSMYYGQGDVFLGIPYAQPPQGNLRFKRPQPLCKLPGNQPYDATYYRDACPQHTSIYGPQKISEDCLHVNVFSPDVTTHSKYPVMVWIHGGSMTSGSASEFPYYGIIRNLVSRGVVVVVMQYRLGMLGFFTTFTDEFPPNLGMLDQVEALRWVQSEISAFGGDPYRTTIFGESAGGASVSAHTYSPMSQNLFQQVIMQSGVVLTSFEGSLGYSGLSESRASTVCGVNRTANVWTKDQIGQLQTCLANADWHDFIKLEEMNLLGWKICQDTAFMPEVPRVLAKKRPNIPALIGNMRDEWAMFEIIMLNAGISKWEYYSKFWFEVEFGMYAGFLSTREVDIRSVLEKTFADGAESPLDWFKSITHIFTGAGFTGFIGRELDSYLEMNNTQVFVYEQTYSSAVGRQYDIPGWNPVPHTAELYFIFLHDIAWEKAKKEGKIVQADYDLVEFYGSKWTNFAKYGTPDNANTWQPMAVDKDVYLEIRGSDSVMRDKYRPEDRVVWSKVVPALCGDYPPEDPDFNNGTVVGAHFETVSCAPVTFAPPVVSNTTGL